MDIVHGIKIDRSRDSLFDELGLRRLRESYMMPEEQSPQERFAFIASRFGSNAEHAQRLYEYSSKHWLSWSTPILSFGRTKKGLPISCFLPYLPDTTDGLVDTQSEVNRLSVMGGGIGIGVGLRSPDEKSTGVMAHLKTYDSNSRAYKQGTTRRGAYAAYLDISHPEIEMFIEMRKATGDQNLRCLNLHHGVNIPDSFMRIIEECMINPEANDDWQLIDPHTKEVKKTVSAMRLWQSILELRAGPIGEPFIHYIDTTNRALPAFQRALGLSVKQSNLCTEITLPTDAERTAVCCLSSVNLSYWDDIKKVLDQYTRDVLEALDNVLQYFIDHAPDTIARARFSAMRERSVGVGALGWHDYLQSKMVPFESATAKALNKQIFKAIRAGLDTANRALAVERGEAPDAEGYGLRCSHVMAVAPNATSSIIMGNTSPSVEPYAANIYRQDTMSGVGFNLNRHLLALTKKIIAERPELDLEEIKSRIAANDGSIAGMDDVYSADEQEVFKTAREIDQLVIIDQAADRQESIDQAQSINTYIRPTIHITKLHAIHFMAWKRGLKTLYYCRNEKIAKADKISTKIARQKLDEVEEKINMEDLADGSVCVACE